MWALAIVDVYSAMTSDRLYRKVLAKEEILRHIAEGMGIQV